MFPQPEWIYSFLAYFCDNEIILQPCLMISARIHDLRSGDLWFKSRPRDRMFLSQQVINTIVEFKVVTRVNTKMVVFCAVVPCSLVGHLPAFRPDDGDSKDPRNVGKHNRLHYNP